jgi:hypothetical protein
MSQLQKKIARIGRSDGPGIGFASAKREKPKAMLLAVLATDAEAAKKALGAGADVLIACGPDGAKTKALIRAMGGNDNTVGAWVSGLDESGAAALQEAGCDFVISTLEATAAGAVDPEKMGLVLVVTTDIQDTILRSLSPFNLEALFFERTQGAMSLADQVELFRFASLSGSQLLVTVATDVSATELRVLRDSGVAVVVAPEGSTAEQVTSLAQRLQEIPVKKIRRDGGDIALVPSAATRREHDHDDDDDDE